jgi:hypothetical protein
MSNQNTPVAQGPRIAIMWTIVGIPLAYGIFKTLEKASQLFTG